MDPMDMHYDSPPPSSACPKAHILNYLGVFGVHYRGRSDGYDFRISDFRCLLWINPLFPYLLLLPHYNPFYRPLFSVFNVTPNTLPIKKIIAMGRIRNAEVQERWGHSQDLIDHWLHLESLLCLMLRTMLMLNGGRVAEGVYTFLTPIFFCYTERRAYSRSSAIDFTMRSCDVFLPLMAQISLLFILLDTNDHNDWRMSELELSAVSDFTIERLGRIIDLSLSKSHLDHRLPQHICWLLPHLLGNHCVPLYFFYGQDFPLKEPIPNTLTSISIVPTEDEVAYLRSFSGKVAFSQWVIGKPTWTCLRDRVSSSSAPSAPSAIPSPHPLPIYDDWRMPIESAVPASFPTVERDSGQKQGEDIHTFIECHQLDNEKRAAHESPDAKKRCLDQEAHAAKGAPPGKKGAHVFIWEEEEGGFFIRRAFNRTDAADHWDEFTFTHSLHCVGS
ncbi:hypothetical protein DFH08DRAFT_957178 [Mycena albidolilacea]|uniref:Uncharacterized protein n=1 Tax=Mycena albidolilacea TaxID=1033008 RepID=A0AAD7EW39_9AGAR|nr:hypothetical protein DFH08DRAFT_957178 [Mycena albidolilacea]